MKFYKLRSIVTAEAEDQRLSAAYNGAWNDGGASSTLSKLEEFRDILIRQEDLRPSEYYKLNNLEVGEPELFSKIIMAAKMKLAKNIQL